MSHRVPVGAPGPESAGALARALAAVDSWGAGFAACAASGPDGVLATHGDTNRVVRVASLTKLVTARAVLLAVEEGAFALADPLGPPGSTVAHLLCHAGGYDFDGGAVLSEPGTRRIYSNTGYEVLAAHVEATTAITFADYMAEGVLDPLGMSATELRGSAAKDMHSNVDDLLRLLGEYRNPTVVAPGTAEAARSVQMPGLDGVLPGWGVQRPCDWGYGPELRGTKSPHWTGSTAGADTLGHFGGSGTLMWLDRSGVGCVALSDREFGEWSVALWPGFSDGVRIAVG
ncbi:MAG: beta-lactamase family protein [Actinomycetia bacterium]|nr:beta-lactamase family protein [Actinomycetes bacterium]